MSVNPVLAERNEIAKLIKEHLGVGGETVGGLLEQKIEEDGIELLEDIETDGSELSEIRDVLHILLNNARTSDTTALPDEVSGLHRKFLKHDIEPDLAHNLAEAMQECFYDEKGRSIHEHLTLLLKKIIKTSEGIKFTEHPTVVALVGPTVSSAMTSFPTMTRGSSSRRSSWAKAVSSNGLSLTTSADRRRWS